MVGHASNGNVIHVGFDVRQHVQGCFLKMFFGVLVHV